MNTDTDHSDLAPPDQSLETTDDSQYLDLGGVSIHGTKAERAAFFEAMAKAQLEFTAAKKDVKNDFFGSKYAPLESIIDAIRPAMNRHGLAPIQPMADGPEGAREVHTIIGHKGGAVLHAVMRLPPVTKVQELGSASTYIKRYSLQAVACVTGEVDDDGNAADGKTPPPPAKNQKAPDPKPGLTRDEQKAVNTVARLQAQDAATLPILPLNGHKSEPPPPLKTTTEPEMMTDDQAELIGAEFKRIKWGKMRAAEYVFKRTGMTSATLTKAGAEVLLFALKEELTPEAAQ